MFVKIVLLWFCLIWIYDIVDNIKIPKRKEKKEPKEKDIWQHPYLVEAGIKKPLEECELEECEFIPLQWQVKYNERSDQYVTIQIEPNDIPSIPSKTI